MPTGPWRQLPTWPAEPKLPDSHVSQGLRGLPRLALTPIPDQYFPPSGISTFMTTISLVPYQEEAGQEPGALFCR